jgi:hypothetical protein
MFSIERGRGKDLPAGCWMLIVSRTRNELVEIRMEVYTTITMAVLHEMYIIVSKKRLIA